MHFHFRILRSDLVDYLSPQTGTVQYICLINGVQNFAVAIFCHLKSIAYDALDFDTVVGNGVIRTIFIVVPFAKISTTCQFSTNYDIQAIQQTFFPYHTVCQKVIILDRTDVAIQPQGFADSQKTAFRA